MASLSAGSPDSPPHGKRPIVIIGAGPAGLTAAYVLTTAGEGVLVLEGEPRVGGLASTIEYKGFRFDIGGHRFFTKATIVQQLWRSMLGPDFVKRARLSRIYYRGRFFDYPLRPANAIANLGVLNAGLVLASYIKRQLRPIRPELSFEAWVTNRFGDRLYQTFFKTYTEKVWGIPCSTIGAQWAAQRIKGLSLRTAITNMLFARWQTKGAIKTLIDQFEYPRFGPGMMWEAFRACVQQSGGRIELRARVTKLHHSAGHIHSVEYDRDGETTIVEPRSVLSTMPLRQLVGTLTPEAPVEGRRAAERLRYRDFLTVAVIVNAPHVFPDQWIYVHDPRVKLGRVQNFKNWSPDMVPDPTKTCLGLEYFCSEGDEIWSMSDESLVRLGREELGRIGLVDPAAVEDGTVVRVRKAYPVYDQGYEQALESVRHYLQGFANLQTAGRNGLHKYNNQDHSMLTAMLAVRNLLGDRHDVWAINTDDEYHEQASARLDAGLMAIETTQPLVPARLG